MKNQRRTYGGPVRDGGQAGDRGREHCEGRPTDGGLIWGRNPVISLLEFSAGRCLKVTISKTMSPAASDRLITLCREERIPFSFADVKALDSLTGGENHQGVAAVVSATAALSLADAPGLLPPAPERALAVLLDHVQDPHNLGAMIRSAEAAGASFVAIPRRRSALPTGTVVKTSAGASLRLPIVAVGNVAEGARVLREDCALWAVGLSADAERSIYDEPLPARTLLVVGGEGKGLGRTTAGACDETLSIPMAGHTGSLNASVALAVSMFEWKRTGLDFMKMVNNRSKLV